MMLIKLIYSTLIRILQKTNIIIYIDSLKHIMSFAFMHTIPLQKLVDDQYNHFNPISKHIKKTYNPNKNKPKETPPSHHPFNPFSQKQLRFRDLSKDKCPYYSHHEKDSNKQNQFVQRQTMGEFARVRRKLQFETTNSASNSKEKSLSFSDVIRMSRQKKLREQSKRKYSNKVIMQNSKPAGKIFNALKNRLIGQGQQPPKTTPQVPAQQQHKLTQRYQLEDMVRISTQFQPTLLSSSLTMAPSF